MKKTLFTTFAFGLFSCLLLTGCEGGFPVPSGDKNTISFHEFESIGKSIKLQNSDLIVNGFEVESVESSNLYTSTNGVRFSSRTSNGNLNINLKKEVFIEGVTLVTTAYSSSENAKATVTTSANKTSIDSVITTGEVNFDFSNDNKVSNSITIASSNRFYLEKIVFKFGKVTDVYPSSISLDDNFELGVGNSKQLTVTYAPGNVNHKDVSFSSSNSNIATVTNEGLVTGVKVGEATITAKAKKENGSYVTANVAITVSETPKAAYTILLYICGSDLESQGGYASSDINEILANFCPNDVNIVMETGGSTKWSNSSYGSKSELGRYVVNGKSLKKVSSVSKAHMGSQSTLESFLTWGLKEYPADKTGVILWNHGGAISGVCFDEATGDYYDGLTAAEVGGATKNALAANNISGKLEWIGYDACLMNVADIATVNSQYYNYMVASQESEAGDGWDYDNWLPTLYKNSSVDSVTLLGKIASTFVQDNGGSSRSNDQCLSVLDLSYADELVDEFNKYAASLGITSTSKFNTLGSAYNNSAVLKFGKDEDYGYLFGVADFTSLLTKLDSTFSNVDSSKVKAAIEKMVVVNEYGGYYTSKVPCGTCAFVAYVSSSYYGLQASKSDYTAKDTLFTNWRNININYSSSWYN